MAIRELANLGIIAIIVITNNLRRVLSCCHYYHPLLVGFETTNIMSVPRMLLAGTEINWRNKTYPLLGVCDIDRARDSSYCTGLGDTFAFFAMLLCTVSSRNS